MKVLIISYYESIDNLLQQKRQRFLIMKVLINKDCDNFLLLTLLQEEIVGYFVVGLSLIFYKK